MYLKVAVFRHDVRTERFVVFEHAAVAKPLYGRHRLRLNLAREVPGLPSPVVDQSCLITRETRTNCHSKPNSPQMMKLKYADTM